MMRMIFVALFWLGLLCPAQAQFNSPALTAVLDRPGSAYIGPGDINGTAFAFWSTRCITKAYSGFVMDVTDSATGNTTGTRLQCDGNGNVVALVSASACTFVTGNSCSTLATTCATACNVRTLYDQSGNTNCTTACNSTISTNANRATLTLNCQNGKICVNLVNANTTCYGTGNVSAATQPQPVTVSYVTLRTGGQGVSSGNIFVASATSNIQAGYAFPANNVNMFAGTAAINVAETDATMHAIQNFFSAASSAAYIDGTNNVLSSTPGTNGIDTANPMTIGCNNSGTSRADVKWFETGAWSSDKTANNAVMNNNQHAYWNF